MGLQLLQVELLRSCQLAVGWSGAMSLATAWDHQDRVVAPVEFGSRARKAFGYSSDARAIHNGEAEPRGPWQVRGFQPKKPAKQG